MLRGAFWNYESLKSKSEKNKEVSLLYDFHFISFLNLQKLKINWKENAHNWSSWKKIKVFVAPKTTEISNKTKHFAPGGTICCLMNLLINRSILRYSNGAWRLVLFSLLHLQARPPTISYLPTTYKGQEDQKGDNLLTNLNYRIVLKRQNLFQAKVFYR